MRNKWIIISSLVAIAVLIFFLKPADQIKFNYEKWNDRSLVYSEPYIRSQMVKDVLNNILEDDLTTDMVIKKLGPQSESDYFSDYQLRYWLGPENGLVSIDSSWLVIKIKNERVEKYEVVTD
ncbi:hypothetical protein MGA5115_02603 [Marinomonas gallaica]|uniref:Uncharacterized protein n=2 Tax=Marinomonas gallaica TaxID=1806667 RepID=A0A1C3JTJ1_9GAMM|nr:hypothetical protein MGA5115_02603 [Marinomonas gallaica]SBT22819.1 hypothetical protein MGA5116_03449 [Marinomonas gallaica]